MKTSSIYKAAALAISAILTISGASALSACSNNQPTSNTSSKPQKTTSENDQLSSQTAAVVDGETITEGDVSAYIEQYRLSIGKTDDTDWATFLDESGLTAEKVRKDAIEKIARGKAAAKKAEQLGITVSDAEIADAVNLTKAMTKGTNWDDFLSTTGYDEKTYEQDIRQMLVEEKLCASEAGFREATVPEMLSVAKGDPDSYRGYRYTAVIYPAKSSSQASSFAASSKNIGEDAFLQAASDAVDSGSASDVILSQWTCLDGSSYTAKESFSGSQVGDVVFFIDDDGTAKVALVQEEYGPKRNGSFSINEMPDAIREKLASDTSRKQRAAASSKYLDSLLSAANLNVYAMPKGLSYDVSMELSQYGKEKTTAELEKEANELVEQQMSSNGENTGK